MINAKILDRLKSYRNGVYGEFFIEVAAMLEILDKENEQLRSMIFRIRELVGEK